MAAKSKKEQEVVEEIKETTVEETETKPKKTKKETTTEETTTEEVEVDPKKEALFKQAQEIKEQHAKQVKLYCKINTPYLAEPNINRNIAGMFPAGTILYVEKIINDGINGSFYKINDKTYINKKWDVEVF